VREERDSKGRQRWWVSRKEKINVNLMKKGLKKREKGDIIKERYMQWEIKRQKKKADLYKE
jgi:hypothetical protein